MTPLSDRPFPDWIPRFNDPLVNVFRPDDAPVRFVQVARVVNVVLWQVTDGAGSFWLMDPRAAERAESTDARAQAMLSATDEELAAALGGEKGVEQAAREVDEVIAKALSTDKARGE